MAISAATVNQRYEFAFVLPRAVNSSSIFALF